MKPQRAISLNRFAPRHVKRLGRKLKTACHSQIPRMVLPHLHLRWIRRTGCLSEIVVVVDAELKLAADRGAEDAMCADREWIALVSMVCGEVNRALISFQTNRSKSGT